MLSQSTTDVATPSIGTPGLVFPAVVRTDEPLTARRTLERSHVKVAFAHMTCLLIGTRHAEPAPFDRAYDGPFFCVRPLVYNQL